VEIRTFDAEGEVDGDFRRAVGNLGRVGSAVDVLHLLDGDRRRLAAHGGHDLKWISSL